MKEDSRLEPIIRIILIFNTNPANFIWSNSVQKWWSYGHQTINFRYLGAKTYLC